MLSFQAGYSSSSVVSAPWYFLVHPGQEGFTVIHMGVEPNIGGFTPPNHPFVHRVLPYKPSILRENPLFLDYFGNTHIVGPSLFSRHRL